jgi:CRP-like cAMP-binding protein
VGADTRNFLSSLRPEDVAAFNVLASPRTFQRGQALVYVGQLADRVLVLSTGRVKVTSSTASGRELVLAFRGPGDLVGELAAFDGEPRSATIRAVDRVDALSLSPQAFRDFVAARPPVALVLLQMLALRLRDADAKRIEFSTYTTIERVAVRLLEFADHFGLADEAGGAQITLPISQEDLAGAAGASIESVGRALATMRSLKCIETRRREITILDPRALAALCADA